MTEFRLQLLEDPGTDEFLLGVKKLLDDSGRSPVLMQHVDDTAEAMSVLANLPLSTRLTGIDFIGHGVPGRLSVGNTTAGYDFVGFPNGNSAHTTLEVRELLGCDVEWIYLALDERRRKASEAGVARSAAIDTQFCVRLLGCDVAYDPGYLTSNRLNTLDGACLIHHLASHLDVPVAGPLDTIFVEDFSSGEFIGGRLRTCWVENASRRVVFDPVAPSAIEVPKTYPVETLVPPDVFAPNRKLFERFDPKALALRHRKPLMKRGLTLAEGAVSVWVAAGGGYIVIERAERSYLLRVRRSSGTMAPSRIDPIERHRRATRALAAEFGFKPLSA